MLLQDAIFGHGDAARAKSLRGGKPARAANSAPSAGQRRRVVLQIAEAMLYLHSRTPLVLHRDLKPGNVLLDDRLNAQVCDFGLSRFLRSDDSRMDTDTCINVGTWRYMAPEAIIGTAVPEPTKLDVYAFAVLACVVFTTAKPYREYESRATKFQVMQEIVSGPWRAAPQRC